MHFASHLLSILTLPFLLASIQCTPLPQTSPPSGDALISTIHKFQETWVENIAVRSNGRILVSLISSPEVWEVDPIGKSAKLIHRIPGYLSPPWEWQKCHRMSSPLRLAISLTKPPLLRKGIPQSLEDRCSTTTPMHRWAITATAHPPSWHRGWNHWSGWTPSSWWNHDSHPQGGDLARDSFGNACIQTTASNTLIKMAPAGEQTLTAGGVASTVLLGCPAAAFGRTPETKDVLYIMTDGGRSDPERKLGTQPGKVSVLDTAKL